MNRHAAQLARSLERTGQDVILRRLTTGQTNRVSVEVTVRAHVRDYVATELVNGIAQGGSHVIIGMAEIERAQWPGGVPETIGGRDQTLPRKGDEMVIDGRVRLVETVVPKHVGGEIVRIDLTVRGT